MASRSPGLSPDTEVSRRSIIFTAWTAAALFGRGLNDRATSRECHSDPSEWMADRSSRRGLHTNLKLRRFQSVARRLALTDSQQIEIDNVISDLQPLIVQLRTELDEKRQQLAMLHPSSYHFTFDTASLSNDIGKLATQIALVKSKLKSDIFALLGGPQQSVLDDLQAAFESYENVESLNDYS